MTWERILKGDEIRKEDGKIRWTMLGSGNENGSIFWKNEPDGFMDMDSSPVLILKGSWRLYPPHNFIEGHSSVEGIILEGDGELLSNEEEGSPDDEIIYFDWDVDFGDEKLTFTDWNRMGSWEKGQLNPSYIDLTIDMKKSKNPDDWEIKIDSLDWDVVE